MPDHPEREQLAAFQAGDGDRKQRAWVGAHLAGCRSCTQVVAAVERARGRLALLAEPELPAGLHDRLAAALDAEAARPLPARARRVWYRRPAAWGAAAAAVLLVALAVPLLQLDRGRDLATAGGGQATQEAARPAAASGPLPMIPLAGELTTGRLQVALHNNPVARQALERAKAGGLAAPQGDQGVGRAGAPETAAGADAGDAQPPSAAAGARDATADQQACLAAATAQAGHQLLPAFLVAGSYRGQPATVLVTATPGSPSQAEFWVFSRGDCSGPPLASGRLR